MFDCVFDPVTEVVNGSPQYNSVNPANRFKSFASRHNKGGIIDFLMAIPPISRPAMSKFLHTETAALPPVAQKNPCCPTSSWICRIGSDRKRWLRSVSPAEF